MTTSLFKKALTSAVLFLFVSSVSDAQVRNIEFGMSPEEVIEAEALTDFDEEESDGLYYIATEGSVGGLDTLIGYIFAEGRLFELLYGFQESYSNENRHITDFNDVDEILTDIYGDPDESITRWINDLYENDRSEWGFAVSLGHLIYVSSWKTEDMEISHTLSGNNYDSSHTIQYTSTEYSYLEDQVKEQQNRSDF